MWKAFVLLFGVVEVLFPDRIVAAGERLAMENPGESRLRPSTIPVARIEGLVWVLAVLENRPLSSRVRRALGAFGLVSALAPARVLAASTALAYENPDAVEWKPWVRPLTRLLGLGYVVLALRDQFGERRSE